MGICAVRPSKSKVKVRHSLAYSIYNLLCPLIYELIMKATELRIGNYVDCFGLSKVISVRPKKVKLEKERKKDGIIIENAPYFSLDLKPILLSEEWLLKFGFEIVFIEGFKHLKIEIGDNYLLLMERNDLPKYSFWIDNLNLGFVKHVHQLQNLFFALTGKELALSSEA